MAKRVGSSPDFIFPQHWLEMEVGSATTTEPATCIHHLKQLIACTHAGNLWIR
jgi:hypothetical protein